MNTASHVHQAVTPGPVPGACHFVSKSGLFCFRDDTRHQQIRLACSSNHWWGTMAMAVGTWSGMLIQVQYTDCLSALWWTTGMFVRLGKTIGRMTGQKVIGKKVMDKK